MGRKSDKNREYEIKYKIKPIYPLKSLNEMGL